MSTSQAAALGVAARPDDDPHDGDALDRAVPGGENHRMTQEGRQSGPRARSALPPWMAPVLLAAAAPGMLVILAALAVSFVGNGPYDDPSFPPPPDLPFVDRASWWLSTVPGALSSVATLAALAAFALVALSRRRDRPVPSRLRLEAVGTTAVHSDGARRAHHRGSGIRPAQSGPYGRPELPAPMALRPLVACRLPRPGGPCRRAGVDPVDRPPLGARGTAP